MSVVVVVMITMEGVAASVGVIGLKIGIVVQLDGSRDVTIDAVVVDNRPLGHQGELFEGLAFETSVEKYDHSARLLDWTDQCHLAVTSAGGLHI